MPATGGVAGPAAAVENAGMRLIAACVLLVLLPVGSARAQESITVYRCVDAKGRVTLQDEPCPAGQEQSKRSMTRPQDAPPAPPPTVTPAAEPAPAPPPPRLPLPPPPPLYVCTSYDGIERESESYDPNPRCEPIVLYHPRPQQLPPEWQTACRWVEDSCVRLSESEACERFKRKQREAQSAARHAFSDTAAYRKSELRRLTRIVEENCR